MLLPRNSSEPCTFASGLVLNRQKRFTNKVKTGCVTCRKRRVKCDESKPTCANCNRGDRICEGYQTPIIGVGWHRKVTRHHERKGTAHIDFPRQPSSKYGKAGDEQWLHRWLSHTAQQVSKFSNPYFWNTLIPQVSWTHESVRQALIAVAIACDESYIPETTGMIGSRTLYHYNQSIRALTRSITDGSATTDIAMLCCVLFWLLENLKNRPRIAMTHLKAAINMLNEHNSKPSYRDDLLTSYIEPMLQEGMILASTPIPTGGRKRHQALLTTDAYKQKMYDLMPISQPRDVYDAQLSFARCQEALLVAKRMAMSPSSPDPDMTLLRCLYHMWKMYLDANSARWPAESVRMLNMHYYMHMLAIDIVETQLQGKNIRPHPSLRPRLQHLLSEAKHFASLAAEKSHSTINLPIIMVLSFVARQCVKRDNDIAEEALATLERHEFFEGIWNSRVAAEVVRLMRTVDLEHEYCDKGDLEAVFERAAFEMVSD